MQGAECGCSGASTTSIASKQRATEENYAEVPAPTAVRSLERRFQHTVAECGSIDLAGKSNFERQVCESRSDCIVLHQVPLQ